MIKHYQQILGTPVLHFEQGNVLGTVKDVIIHPDTGKLEALWVKPKGALTGYAVLQTQDIVEWKKNIYAKGEESLAEAGEIIKIAEILSDGRQILGNRVRTESGESLGRVKDVDFDTEHFYLRQLYTQKSLLGLWAHDNRILSYDLIVEVLPGYILVKDRTEKTEKVKASLLKDKNVVLDV
ncbi:MAG: PRC-barrel domain-containing protein [Candidatus Peregrinibacteria bacterium]